MTFDAIAKAIVDDAQAHLSVSELAAQPLGALAGLSHTEGKQVMEAFQAKTIAEFASSKYVRWAQAITYLANYETTDFPTPALAAILDQKWEKKRLRDLAKASPAIFAGMSDKEAKLIAEVLGAATVEDLASNRFVLKAQAIAHLAAIERDRTFRKAA